MEVKIHERDDGVRISIRDYGPGVSAEDLPHIFDPFFRAGASRDPGGGNVGLGLAIARRAVLIHHGNITAENAPVDMIVSKVLLFTQRCHAGGAKRLEQRRSCQICAWEITTRMLSLLVPKAQPQLWCA